MVGRKKLIIRTNRPIGFIITDAKGNVLRKGGPTKLLLKENLKFKKRMKKK